MDYEQEEAELMVAVSRQREKDRKVSLVLDDFHIHGSITP